MKKLYIFRKSTNATAHLRWKQCSDCNNTIYEVEIIYATGATGLKNELFWEMKIMENYKNISLKNVYKKFKWMGMYIKSIEILKLHYLLN